MQIPFGFSCQWSPTDRRVGIIRSSAFGCSWWILSEWCFRTWQRMRWRRPRFWWSWGCCSLTCPRIMRFVFYFEASGFHPCRDPLRFHYSWDGPLAINRVPSGRCCSEPRSAGKGMRLWRLPWLSGVAGAGLQGAKRVDYSRAATPSCWIYRVGCRPNNQFFWQQTGRGWSNFWGAAPALSSASTTPWTTLGLNYVKLLWFISSFFLHDKL